jgi:GDP-L-fucose synthase
MDRNARIYVAGHAGLVGSALVRRLEAGGHRNLLLRTRDELDLTRADDISAFFRDERPEFVFLAAARVGGILANSTHPVEFLRENLLIQLNVIHAAYGAGVQRLLFLGSSCIYPKHAPQPMREEHLLTGPLEPTNEPYAIAKIAGIKLCQAYKRQHGVDFVSVMPTNLYGPGDSFDLETSHVLPALIRKFHEAKVEGREEVEVWGTGTPRREFMHVNDMADACVFIMNYPEPPELANVGVGADITIRELAELIGEVVEFEGRLRFDMSKPDGTPRKLLDTSRLDALGWRATTPLRYGIRDTYRWFRERSDAACRNAPCRSGLISPEGSV